MEVFFRDNSTSRKNARRFDLTMITFCAIMKTQTGKTLVLQLNTQK